MTTAWHGPEPEWKSGERESWIYEWISDGGTGMLGFQWHEVPNDCLDFVIDQFARFNIPFNKDILDVARVGAYSAFHWVDICDPYALFWNCSDVNMTEDWAHHTYELHDLYGHSTCKEADPESLETFVFVPGQCEAIFEHCYARPGLDALPNGIGLGIRDLLDGSMNGEECWDGLDGDSEKALKELCRLPSGEIDKKRMMAYFELAAWAGFLWLAGPYGREVRRGNLIIDTAMRYGESIMIEGSIISPENFRKIARHPQSCYRCGVASWCVELTQDMGTTRYVCSSCANAGLPPMSQFHCGTVLCKYASCPHNPFFAEGQGGMYAAARASGQLGQMARAKHTGMLLQSEGQLRLSSG